MTNAQKRRLICWGPPAGLTLFFVVSYACGGSGQMFLATWLFTRIPMFLVPYLLYHWNCPRRRWRTAITFLTTWFAIIFGAFLWDPILYHLLWRQFGWGMPDLPGEALVAITMGWLGTFFVMSITRALQELVDRRFPLVANDREQPPGEVGGKDASL